MKYTLLITGWTWYIGSHCVIKCLELWYNVIILDNLSNSEISILDKIQHITGKNPKFYHADLTDKNGIEQVFLENKIDGVIHFASSKAVWESCEKPYHYYWNNIFWSVNLFEIMDKYHVKNIIFSSSAAVYNGWETLPWDENTPTGNTVNPYWTTKYIIEKILKDISIHKWFNVVSLRYFNVIWSHKSWLIWENLYWIQNNLLPSILKSVMWEWNTIKIFWNDYPTKDGTAERDYINVWDLVEGHILAWEYIVQHTVKKWFFEVFNLWTWTPTSVLTIIHLIKEVSWVDIPYTVVPRRKWDLPVFFCDPTKAHTILKWHAQHSLKGSIEDNWNFLNNIKKNR